MEEREDTGIYIGEKKRRKGGNEHKAGGDAA